MATIVKCSWLPALDIEPPIARADLDLAKSLAIFFIDSVDTPVIRLVVERLKSDKFEKVFGTGFLFNPFCLFSYNLDWCEYKI